MFVAALVLTLVDVILAVTLREELVYPELLQQRSDDGRLLLRIDRDMTLQLQRSSVLADDLFFSTNAGGKSENTLWNGSRIQENLYHDSKHQSSVMLYQDDHTLKVEGILSATLRIKPMPLGERSGDPRILHKVYEIEDPKREFGKSLDTWVIPFNVPWFDIPWGPPNQQTPQQPPLPPPPPPLHPYLHQSSKSSRVHHQRPEPAAVPLSMHHSSVDLCSRTRFRCGLLLSG
uniref:Reprolysin n=1 Tax=Rhipicephalus appendiculatus TaxID=34631 RepID=A0A131YNB1_RHIAP